MTARNDITGDLIMSKGVSNETYRERFDQIFGKREKKKTRAVDVHGFGDRHLQYVELDHWNKTATLVYTDGREEPAGVSFDKCLDFIKVGHWREIEE